MTDVAARAGVSTAALYRRWTAKADVVADAGHTPMSAIALDVLADTVVAFQAHYAGPAGASIARERLIKLVDHVLIVLLTGSRAT